MPKEDYTEEQLRAVAELVADHIGGHWQTGNQDGCIVLWVKMEPNTPSLRYEVDRAGTVIHG